MLVDQLSDIKLTRVDKVDGNEKAYWLNEAPFMAPDFSGFHRYQIIQVKRGDNLSVYIKDMGHNNFFKGVRIINIPSLWEHTVDELKFLADQIRNETAQEEIDIKELLGLLK
jgi:hypothetical protein